MAIVLITGGNKGLGYETARKLIAFGNKVYIGCRDKERSGQRALRVLRMARFTQGKTFGEWDDYGRLIDC